MQFPNAYLVGFAFVVCLIVFVEIAESQDAIFLKASKSVPRIGKRSKNSNNNNNNNSDDFEKFFLKASKSVPRIGRRRSEDDGPIRKSIKLPDIAELYEFNPDIFSSPQLVAEYLNYINSMRDLEDVEDGDWRSWVRVKRTMELNDANRYKPELFEYRFQP